MKWGFILVTLYMGPLGLLLYMSWRTRRARRGGKWLLHCHIPHHTTNNNVEQKGGGGLTMILEVAEP
jgi:FtsP/CotA-like multicopper oxidase with cupredoxin domain